MTFERPVAGRAPLALALCVMAGCASLVIDPPSTAPGDWRTEGGADRAHRAPAAIIPPLAAAWAHDVDAAVGPGGAASAGPVVVVPTLRGDLIGLDTETGERLGRARLAGPVRGAPLLVGDLAIAATAAGSATVEAHDLRADRPRWRPRVGAVEASPARSGGNVIVAAASGDVFAFRIADGEEVWRAEVGAGAGIFAAPLAAGGLVAVADDRGAVTAFDAASGEVRWVTAVGGPVYAAPSHADGQLYLASARGTVDVLDLATGDPHWRHTLDQPARVNTPALGGGLAVITASDGSVRALNAASGAEVWRAEAPGGIAAPPLLAGGLAFVATLRGRVLAFDLISGEAVWAGTARGPVRAAMAPAGEGLLIASEPRHVELFLPAGTRADAAGSWR